ncbi:hypothetical protein [Photorhabdus sp. RW14-46]|uniref:hypothetical protein n=1 Tax=Photorhabdus sp. RW14-46 TaxID=2100168 RepID=UPI0013F4076D|nr:hypothetical protein [Photorhabdus sp. RW14-46]NHB59652.1 hypothetical protein [Photorhabdus sp. RW14-46]
MSNANDIINSLRMRSVALGWDAVVAYDRNKVNQLLLQQYIEKRAAGVQYPPISFENEKYGIKLQDVVLGVPLISFEDSKITASQATATMKFISGSIVYTNSNGQVIKWEKISPANNYAIKLNVNLEYGNGVVENIGNGVSENSGKVVIKFEKGTLLDIEGLNDAPAEIVQYFRQYIQSNPNEYILGVLKPNNGKNRLYPKKFIVRTQPAPSGTLRDSKNYGDGAVLLFIATNYNAGGGNLPGDNYPYIIPEGKSAALIIGNATLFGNIFAEHFKKYIDDAAFTTINSGQNSPVTLQFTGGYTPTNEIIDGSVTFLDSTTRYKSCDEKGEVQVAHLPFNKFTIAADVEDNESKHVVLQFPENHTYNHRFSASWSYYGPAGWIHQDYLNDYTFSCDGKCKAEVSLKENNIISFSTVGKITVKCIKSEHSRLSLIESNGTEKMANQLTDKINKTGFFELPDINTFYIQHILFPNSEVLEFDQIAVPGDLVLFGDISPTLTGLKVEPAEILLSANKTQQFTVTPAKNVKWSISPVDLGSISASGLYTAPSVASIGESKP